ncbi:MAG: co-chaperone GroES [Patescibacteria group bacterium]|nr:co-chaperone GroES [Patescibacteria group bacterium]
MNLRPITDHLVLKTIDQETTTASGIIIPETVDKERPEKGKVVAVGPGRVSDQGTRLPLEIKVGDTVVFKKYAPDEVKIDGEKYLVIKADDVMAVIE